MRNVPSRSLGKELGLRDGELSDPEDEVEARVRSELSPRQDEIQLMSRTGQATATPRYLFAAYD